MFIDKIMELYREACVHGLPASLSLSHHNGRESFSFTTIPGPDLAGRPECRRRPHGGRRRRGRVNHGASAGQPTDAAPSNAAVARSPLLPLVSHTAKGLGGSTLQQNSPGRHVHLWTPAPPAPLLPTPTPPTTSSLPLTSPLPTAAAIDVFPISSAAAVSHAEEPSDANSLHCDGLANAAADAHPRRRRCKPPPFLMQLRGRSSSPNIISSLTPSTPPSSLF